MRESTWNLLKRILDSWNDEQVSNQAAALAFYTVFSLAPLLLICIATAGLVLGKDKVQTEILNQIAFMLGTGSAEQIQIMLNNASKPFEGVVTTILGIGILLFGASGFFKQMQTGLNAIWQVKPKPYASIFHFIQDRFLSFTMVLGVAFLLLVSLIISTALVAIANYYSQLLPGVEIMWLVVNFIFSTSVITILFAMIFKFLPETNITWRDVWLGALVTAFLFTLGKYALSIYLTSTDIGSSYGAAGSFIIILVWVYYTARILYFGAKLTTFNAAKKAIDLLTLNTGS